MRCLHGPWQVAGVAHSIVQANNIFTAPERETQALPPFPCLCANQLAWLHVNPEESEQQSHVSAEPSVESDSVAAHPPTTSICGGAWLVSQAWECLPGPALPPPLAQENAQRQITGWQEPWYDTAEEAGRWANSKATRYYRNYPERHFASL